MRRYIPFLIVVIAGVFLAIIIFDFLSRIGVSQNICQFFVLSLGSAVSLFVILPLFVTAYYNSQEDAIGLTWALQQGPLIRHPGASEISNSYRCSFHLTGAQLTSIYNLLKNRMVGSNRNTTSTIIEIHFSRRHREIRNSLRQVFSFDNSEDEEVQRLKIEICNRNLPQAASVSQISLEFLKEGYASIRYYILGNDPDEVADISKKLDKIIRKNLKQFPTFLIGLLLFLSLTWILLEVYLLYILKAFQVSIPVVYAILFVVIVLLVSIGAISCLIYFPKYNFYWKDYINYLDKKHSKGKFVINNVFGAAIGIFIGVISGILANYFSAKIDI